MIVMVISKAEAETLHARCEDEALRAKLAQQIRADLLADEAHPRTVILEDCGDGLNVTAVAYFTPEAADRAADRWWQLVVEDHEQFQAATPLLAVEH